MATKDQNEREGAVVSDPKQPGVSSGKTVKDASEKAGDFSAENDPNWKQNFPQAAAAGASRDEYQMTADARRIQAERAVNLEKARQAKVNGEPTPSGESDNPHEGEAQTDVPKHGGADDRG